MAALLPTLELWRAAEQRSQAAQRRWLASVYAGDVDPATLQALRADVAETREAAHGLFVAAMRECERAALSLHHRARRHVEDPGAASWP